MHGISHSSLVIFWVQHAGAEILFQRWKRTMRPDRSRCCGWCPYALTQPRSVDMTYSAPFVNCQPEICGCVNGGLVFGQPVIFCSLGQDLRETHQLQART